MLTRYEKIMINIIGFTDFIRHCFLKTFPVVGTVVGVLFAYGLVGAMEHGHIYPEHIPYIYGAGITFTALAILWFALTYKDKLRAKRGYYERKERR